MTKHTPGEWKVVDSGGLILEICVGDRCIADVPFDDDEVPGEIPDEAEANAQLIAAAPRMYEALREAEKALSAFARQGGYEIEALNTARKAVALADGKETPNAG